MVELCSAERFSWTAMTLATAIVAATPWLHSTYEHGKLMPSAPAPPQTPSSRAGIGSLLNGLRANVVPKRLFAHFYLLCLVSTTLVFADVFFYGGSLFTDRVQSMSKCSRIAGRSNNATEMGVESLVCLFLLTLHAARRLWECIAVTNWGSSRMTIISYAVGIAHYQLMVLTVLAEAPPLASLVRDRGLVWGGDNYSMYSNNASGFGPVLVAVAGSVTFRHAVAVGLFVVGFVRQHEAIRHLASLRGGRGRAGDGSSKATTTNTYAIPTEGWFQHVSSPHYLAELLVYSAFVVLGSFKGRGLGQGYLVAFAWVFANQALVGGRTHAWYQQKFEDYPRERKRLIPGVW
ncbi:unnamed protein product [Scytosiphon promiscuus]